MSVQRRDRGAGGAHHAGYLLQRLVEPIDQLRAGGAVIDERDAGRGADVVLHIDGTWQLDFQAQETGRVDAEVHALKADERLDDEACADEQHERQCDLHDHEALQLQHPRSAAARARARLVQRPDEVRPRHLQRRDQAEDDACGHAHPEAEQEDAGVEANRVEARKPRRRQGDERAK